MAEGQILASAYPELTEQWNYEKNGDLTPWVVTTGSHKKVWWTCSLGHDWEAVVKNRVFRGNGCPYCAGQRAWPGFNDLATLRPDMVAEWDYELNGDKQPTQFREHSAYKACYGPGLCRSGFHCKGRQVAACAFRHPYPEAEPP